MMTTFRLILLTGLIVCAAATALTKKPRRGSPSTLMLAGSVQSGWQMMPTL